MRFNLDNNTFLIIRKGNFKLEIPKLIKELELTNEIRSSSYYFYYDLKVFKKENKMVILFVLDTTMDADLYILLAAHLSSSFDYLVPRSKHRKLFTYFKLCEIHNKQKFKLKSNCF